MSGIFVLCLGYPPPCCKHCWRVVSRCSCSCSNSLFFSGSPSGKPGFSFRKPLPTGDSKISKCLKCAPVQAGTLPRGAKVSETHDIVLPPESMSPPRGGGILIGVMDFSVSFGHFWTSGKGSRLHGSAFQHFADCLVC